MRSGFPQNGDVLVSCPTATIEHSICIVPERARMTCATHDQAIASGRELAERLHVDAETGRRLVAVSDLDLVRAELRESPARFVLGEAVRARLETPQGFVYRHSMDVHAPIRERDVEFTPRTLMPVRYRSARRQRLRPKYWARHVRVDWVPRESWHQQSDTPDQRAERPWGLKSKTSLRRRLAELALHVQICLEKALRLRPCALFQCFYSCC